MPELSVTALMIAKIRRPSDRPEWAYGRLPRWLRALDRLGIAGEERIQEVISCLWGVTLWRIRHENGVPDYSEWNITGMEAAADAALRLQNMVTSDPAFRWLAARIGQKPALAYLLLNLSSADIWPHFRELTACRAQCPGDKRIVLVWAPGLPHSWERAIMASLPEIGFAIFRWPKSITAAARIRTRLTSTIRSAGVLLRAAARVPGWKKPIPPSRRTLAVEFVDPARLSGGIYDADCWAGARRLPSRNLLLYVTSGHARYLRRRSVSRRQVEQIAHRRGYRMVWLDTQPISPHLVRRWAAGWARFLATSWGSPACERILRYALPEALEFENFLETCRPDAVMHFRIPNGDTGWRTDSGLITGLCRAHAVRSFGCQNRVIYGRLYEFAFDCYDTLFLWGRGWLDLLGPALVQFVEKIEFSGCLNLDELFESVERRHGEAGDRPAFVAGTRHRAVIFTGDTGGSHVTLDYNIRFLAACAALAARHPKWEFAIKCKHCADRGKFELQSDFGAATRTLKNIGFIDAELHSYSSAILEAGFVLAIGFTTPGVEALLLGIPSLYYCDLKWGRLPPQLEFMTVHSTRAMIEAFERPKRATDADLASLDPWRTSGVRARILGRMMRLDGDGAQIEENPSPYLSV